MTLPAAGGYRPVLHWHSAVPPTLSVDAQQRGPLNNLLQDSGAGLLNISPAEHLSTGLYCKISICADSMVSST